uniref:Sec-independent protein translocase TatC n=1 Tax=Chromera velia TaxID=505693 RepID=D9IXH4_9ALVE|nr:Sec-independent protein translocase TatC [Chromera velia]ADJ66502.2 Sec-independent protein translocase TatC [Chromera velia]
MDIEDPVQTFGEYEFDLDEVVYRLQHLLFLSVQILCLSFIVSPIVSDVVFETWYFKEVSFMGQSVNTIFFFNFFVSFLLSVVILSSYIVFQIFLWLDTAFLEDERLLYRFLNGFWLFFFLLALGAAIFLIFPLYWITVLQGIKFLNIQNFQSIVDLSQFTDLLAFLVFSTWVWSLTPILQIVILYLNLITVENLISNWKYVIIFSMLGCGILTASADPLPQLLLALVINLFFIFSLILYKSLFHNMCVLFDEKSLTTEDDDDLFLMFLWE